MTRFLALALTLSTLAAPQAFATGQTTLQSNRDRPDPQALQIRMKNVLVTSYQTSGSAD